MNTFSFKNYVTKYEQYLKKIFKSYSNYIPCILTNWDNTSRYQNRGFVLTNPDPKYFKLLLESALHIFKDKQLPFIIIKAWNEWAEGNFLEPDKEYNLQRLEAVKNSKL